MHKILLKHIILAFHFICHPSAFHGIASLKNKNSLVLWLSLSPWITRHLCSPRGQIYLKALLSSMLLNVQTHHKICHVTKAHVTHCAHMFLAAGVDFHVPKVFMLLWLLVRRKELQVLLSCIFNSDICDHSSLVCVFLMYYGYWTISIVGMLSFKSFTDIFYPFQHSLSLLCFYVLLCITQSFLSGALICRLKFLIFFLT